MIHFTHEHMSDEVLSIYRTVCVLDTGENGTIVWAKRSQLSGDEPLSDFFVIETDAEALFNLFGSNDGDEIFKQITEDWAKS